MGSHRGSGGAHGIEAGESIPLANVRRRRFRVVQTFHVPWEKRLSRQARGGRVRWYRLGPRHGRLTASPASASVTLIILRVADLAAALPMTRRVLARRGWAGKKVAFLSILQGCFSMVLHVWAIEFLVHQQSFSAAC